MGDICHTRKEGINTFLRLPCQVHYFQSCESDLQSLKPWDDGEPGHGHDREWEDGPGQPPAPCVEDTEGDIGLPDVGGD